MGARNPRTERVEYSRSLVVPISDEPSLGQNSRRTPSSAGNGLIASAFAGSSTVGGCAPLGAHWEVDISPPN